MKFRKNISYAIDEYGRKIKAEIITENSKDLKKYLLELLLILVMGLLKSIITISFILFFENVFSSILNMYWFFIPIFNFYRTPQKDIIFAVCNIIIFSCVDLNRTSKFLHYKKILPWIDINPKEKLENIIISISFILIPILIIIPKAIKFLWIKFSVDLKEINYLQILIFLLIIKINIFIIKKIFVFRFTKKTREKILSS